MISIFIILLVLVAILLMGVILIQSSKGGGLAGTFGGGGADASMVFGVRRTADFLIKLTSILATVLLLFSLITNVLINKSGGTNESIIQQNSGQQNFPQPNVPNEMQQPQQQDPNQQQQQQPVDPNQQPPK
ncbi:MAG: preprotein translocase subunit SecG [Ignavibacteria bacterium]|nr:preprotein translocase subunit SecG [Ignavibacteria bacterium]